MNVLLGSALFCLWFLSQERASKDKLSLIFNTKSTTKNKQAETSFILKKN